ncbi:MAG: ATP-binding cassette domain-containing protein [Acidobacteriota bacterium]
MAETKRIGVRKVTVAFGGAPVLDGATFHAEVGERIALVGRNGSGKSTLLKVLAEELPPDEGEVLRTAGLRVARLTQEVPQDLTGEIYELVASGVAELGALLAEYHRLSLELEGGAGDLHRMEQVQNRLEAAGGWEIKRRVKTVITRLNLPHSGRFETLSGGLKRRVLLARALVAEPDVLLLDEPTNHFDIPAIEWLEEGLLAFAGALIFVTHDRAFLRRLATRIVELDRGRLTDSPGDWGHFLEQRRQRLEVEARHADKFDKKLAQEEAWIRQGLKARRTRNEGRVRALERLREERRARRATTGTARLRVEAGGRSGKIVFEAEGVTFTYGSGATAEPVVRDVSTTILSGDKVGILGPNGSGKSTLLKLLLGDLEPATGRVRRGTRLDVAYFDQHREQLDDEESVADNVAEGSDKVTVGGKTRHIISYLADFLFTPEQTRGPVKALSGGERNRLLLARLFTRPANVLVLDEPTNDLDIETLELLEALLVEFSGTLLVVSHDRAFLDNVVTSTLVMEGDGRVGEYAGGYSDWLRQRAPQVVEAKPAEKTAARPPGPPPGGRRKLSNREREDLATAPARIEALEQEQRQIHADLASPETYKEGGDRVTALQNRLAEIEPELERLYERWAELEELAG